LNQFSSHHKILYQKFSRILDFLHDISKDTFN